VVVDVDQASDCISIAHLPHRTSSGSEVSCPSSYPLLSATSVHISAPSSSLRHTRRARWSNVLRLQATSGMPSRYPAPATSAEVRCSGLPLLLLPLLPRVHLRVFSRACASRALLLSCCAFCVPLAFSLGTTRQNDPCSYRCRRPGTRTWQVRTRRSFLLWSSCSSRARGLLHSRPISCSNPLMRYHSAYPGSRLQLAMRSLPPIKGARRPIRGAGRQPRL
jgi:hypothetical protein